MGSTKRSWAFGVLAAATVFCGACAPGKGAAGPPAQTDEASGGAAGDAVVVVELFTSQGCSSCPPADAIVSELAQAGPQVLPLSFHVDYWDYIGWSDPLASPAWSERQRRYANATTAGRIYTPQLLFNGRDRQVRTRRGRVELAVEAAAAEPVLVDFSAAAHVGEDGYVVDAQPRWRGVADSEAPALDVVVAVYEDGLSTPITRGENAGRTLFNDRVVRALDTACTVAPDDPTPQCHVEIAHGEYSGSGVVVFAQDPQTLTIHGAQRVTL